ncbi:hypothetical protein CCAX7_65050 [Capsulimonas corticalis]|uniref:Uncharacterized protein n=1 Tax=Capsulimonas corticalis TaxID=2219043 RepID=A0A402CQX1_9BACT|nr:hypothetical protein [Capsulimonas corticalis]BDI34454.1 hypothetical protein CCAX7_65050 [Capsulimonas corticalis]
MPPATFNCTRCQAPLTPGSTQCTNCGLTFDTPVPYAAAPGYAAPPAKKTSPIAIIAIIGAVGCLPMIAIMAAILFPVFARAREKAREDVSMNNLRSLGLASLQFTQDHDEKLPPLDTMEHFKAAVSQYIPAQNGQDLYTEPGANVPYALNAKISKKSLETFSDPTKVVLIREAVPHSDGKIATVYVDGHVTLETPGP